MLWIHALQLQATRHEKLNLVDSPCNASSDYDLGHCVEKSVFKRIGCQLPWGRVEVDGLPLCHHNRKMLENHSMEYWNAIEYGRDQMIERTTNCLLPCSYMEYTVRFKLLRHLLDFFVCSGG